MQTMTETIFQVKAMCVCCSLSMAQIIKRSPVVWPIL